MKRRIRQQMRQILLSVPSDQAATRSRTACGAVVGLEEFGSASSVMIYLSIPGEVDPADIARAAWRDGKRVLAPRVNWRGRQMDAIEISSLADGIVTDEMGLSEPAGGEPMPLERIDLIIVPALAFDRRGNRLGRGKGFYDRFLGSPGIRATLCGLGFSEQLIDELPADEHDKPVDIVVTDKEVLRFSQADN